MCRAVTCRTCRGTTWAGCGQHVDAVLRDVPRDQRCRCHETAPVDQAATGTSLLARIFRQ